MRERLFWVLVALIQTVGASAQNIQRLPYRYISKDSVVAIASNRYEAHSFLRRFFMGKNYREVWRQPVTVPVFRLSQSGFRIEELGGGMQTKSLHLLDTRGKEWALRSVEKYVRGALPRILHHTLAEKVSQDLISASLPYGAPVTGELARAAGITAPRPQVFFVADDPALGKYRHLFANTLCTLEERDPRFRDTENTKEVLENIRKDPTHKIQQKVLLRARLLDMLLADWDRHADNWRWGEKDSAGFTYYYAIPRDRDWVFYQSLGVIPWLARWIAMPHLVNFQEESRNIKAQSYKAWRFDKTFLNELDAKDWEMTIKAFQQALTDAVVEKAVKKLPKEAYALVGRELIDKVKSRSNSFLDNVLQYYRFLSEEVWINGSDEEELFRITADDHHLTVTVFSLPQKPGAARKKIYQRTFSPSETYFLVLHGLGGNDRFEVDEKVQSRIKVKIHGDEGKDSYSIKGNVKTWLYDRAAEQNLILHKGRAKVRFR